MGMLISLSGKSLIPSSFKLSPLRPCKRNGRQLEPTWSRKPSTGDNPQEPTFTLRVSKAFLARSAVAVFALGFLDAGYSGDWSRIGVITKDTEDLLKNAAFLIEPLCLLSIFYTFDDGNSS